MAKSAEAFRTISEVAEWLGVQTHVLRFWESKFPQVKPVKRAGGRRYYRPNDMALLAGIRVLLHDDGVTIRGVQKILREKGVKHVAGLRDRPLAGMEDEELSDQAEAAAAGGEEPGTEKVIPMQPVGNVANLFGNSDAQAPEPEEKTPEAPEPLTLFSHRAEPAVDEVPAGTESPAAEAAPAFSHTATAAPETKDRPAADPTPAEATVEPEETAAPVPEAPPVSRPDPAIKMPPASPSAGPELAAVAAAAARLAPEDLIARGDRIAPAARRLQELHARMSGKTG